MSAGHARIRGGFTLHVANAIITVALINVMGSRPAAAQDQASPYRIERNWSVDEFAQALDRMPISSGETRAALLALHAGYLRSFNDELAAARAASDRAAEVSRLDVCVDPSMTHPWRDAADHAGGMDIWLAWPVVVDTMRSAFEVDVHQLLPDDTRSMWESEVRTMRRARALPIIRQHRRIRCVVDLVPLVSDLTLSDRESSRLDDARSAYELACDAALIQWEQSRVIERRFHAFSRLRPDPTQPLAEVELREFMKLSDQLDNVANAIRDVHIASAESMLAALDEHRAELQDRLDRAWFEVVFLPSPVEVAADALLEDGKLDEAQRKAVTSIRERYAAALAAQHRSIIDAMKRWEEPAEVKRRAAAEQAMIDAGLNSWGPEGPESHHPAEPLLRRRLDLAREGCAELRALFDDAQYPSLPVQVRLLLDWPANGG